VTRIDLIVGVVIFLRFNYIQSYSVNLFDHIYRTLICDKWSKYTNHANWIASGPTRSPFR